MIERQFLRGVYRSQPESKYAHPSRTIFEDTSQSDSAARVGNCCCDHHVWAFTFSTRWFGPCIVVSQGDPIFEQKAHLALEALYERRSSLGLVGNTINADSGESHHKHYLV